MRVGDEMRLSERQEFELYARLPVFRQRVEQAQALIADALNLAPAYVAESWGKDSLVLLHLVQTVTPYIPAVCLTTPFDEQIDNYAETSARYIARYPTNYMPLDMQGDHVPEKFRRAGLWTEWPLAFIGIRAEESRGRRWSLKTHGLLYQYQTPPLTGSWRCCPLAWWSWRDVWAYIVLHDLPYLASYDHPHAPPKSQSRTCTHLSKDGSGTAVSTGRIAFLKQHAPEYYRQLQQHYPEIAANV